MLEIRDLSKAFGTTVVLREFSWSVPSGAVVGLTGPIGSGKTTLLRVVAGLECPDAGEIIWESSRWSSRQHLLPPWKRPLSMVFQQPTLWPHLTVRGQLEFVVRSLNFTATERRRRVLQLLERLALDPHERRYPAELSGGQQQCVALARALVRNPKLLLLDEPFSQMDDAAQAHAWAVVRDFQLSSGATLVLVTHDVTWAAASCQSVRSMERVSG